jgi:hypothetical protein
MIIFAQLIYPQLISIFIEAILFLSTGFPALKHVYLLTSYTETNKDT